MHGQMLDAVGCDGRLGRDLLKGQCAGPLVLADIVEARGTNGSERTTL
jgi:hypothetical protein